MGRSRARSGVAVAVVTATRGELGAVVPGPLSALEGTPELEPHRVGELTAALRALGAEGPYFLGDPPARAIGLAPRRYTDSGMRWITPTVAGPGDEAGPDAFTAAEVAEAAADLAAFLRFWRADLVVSYESDGGYGHPDHVQVHRVTRRAAEVAARHYVQINISVVQRQNATAIPQTCTVVTALKSAIASIYGEKAQAVGIGGATVASFLRHKGLPAAVWACLENTCHQPDERSSITATIKDAQVFAHILMNTSHV